MVVGYPLLQLRSVLALGTKLLLEMVLLESDSFKWQKFSILSIL